MIKNPPMLRHGPEAAKAASTVSGGDDGQDSRLCRRFQPLLSAEQLCVLDSYRHGDDLNINAFAGTGKTTTLRILGEATNGPGIYLAFNKSIANSAERRFPANVRCRTIHSFAFREIQGWYPRGYGKLTERLFGNQVAAVLDLGYYALGNQSGLNRRSQ